MSRTVIHFSDSVQFGGTEQALLHLLAGLDRRQWRVVLFHCPAPGVDPLVDGARALGVELRPVPRLAGPRRFARIPGLVQQIRGFEPAIFHAHLTWPLACRLGVASAALAGVRAIVATSQLFVELPSTSWINFQHRVLTACIDRYLAVSQEVRRRLEGRFGVPKRKIRVVPNAIDLSPFHTAAVAGPSAPPTRPVVLTVARLDQQKGLSYLLAAATQVPDAQFLVAGEGDERATLEEQARLLGLGERVRFLGYRADIPELLSHCDLFVLPSLFEGLPLSILEAMAAGKPVVASAIGGTDEAVAHGETGLLVPPRDPTALALAIRKVLGDRDLGRRLGAAGRERVEREFSAEAMVRRVSEVYEELLVGSNGAGARGS